MVSNAEMASRALSRSERWLQGAARALKDRRWDDAVFSSQMAVEVSSKAVLLALGVEFPKRHDVSAVFREVTSASKLPGWFEVDRLSADISTFAKLRALAEYAYERGEDASRFRDEAAPLMKEAKSHVGDCGRLLAELFGGKKANDARRRREAWRR